MCVCEANNNNNKNVIGILYVKMICKSKVSANFLVMCRVHMQKY